MATATAAPTDHAPLHDALNAIASSCDGAVEQDGRGFNATHAYDGARLAAIDHTDWTPEMAGTAWHMLRTYRGQLARTGIDFDALPVPPAAQDITDEHAALMRERAREQARNIRWMAAQRAKRFVLCAGENQPVILSFPYDPAMVDEARRIPGRRYHGTYEGHEKVNVYPFASLGAVLDFAEAHDIPVPGELTALRALADNPTAPAPVRPDAAVEHGRIVVRAPFDEALNDALRAYNGDRSTWDKGLHAHVPPAHYDPAALARLFAAHKLTVSDGARELLDAEAARQQANRVAATALAAEPVEVPGLAEDATLKPHQHAAVRFALTNRRVILGDEMGFGKTNQALAALAADNAYPATVVCRPSLTLNWKAEINRFFPGLAVHVAEGTKPAPVPTGTHIVVIGSAALGTVDKENSTKTRKAFPWVEQLDTLGLRALVVDEGQDGKESTANRTKALKQLAKPVTARGGLVLDLTGTPLVNRPKELLAQLEMLGRAEEFGGGWGFLTRYCKGETTRWGTKFDAAHHTAELNARLLAWGIMIRRTDVSALGLPPCTMHEMAVPAADLDPDVMAAYRAAERGIAAELADVLAKASRRAGRGEEALRAAFAAATSTHHLAQITGLRQLAGAAKRPAVACWVAAQVGAGEKVMVAAHHREEVDAYAKAFGGLKIQGGQSVRAKETDKARFQGDPTAPVISVAIAAGGVGHTLTAARLGVQAELCWTPGETNQMMKRLHRIGQTRPVEYFVALAEGTIDAYVWGVVRDKQRVLDAVLDGRVDDTAGEDDEKAVAVEVAWQLARKGLATRSAA